MSLGDGAVHIGICVFGLHAMAQTPKTRRDNPIQAVYMFDQVVTLLAHTTVTRRRYLVALHSRESAAI